MTTRVLDCKSAEECNAISLPKYSAAMDEAVGSSGTGWDLERRFAILGEDFKFEMERLPDKLGYGEDTRAPPLVWTDRSELTDKRFCKPGVDTRRSSLREAELGDLRGVGKLPDEGASRSWEGGLSGYLGDRGVGETAEGDTEDGERLGPSRNFAGSFVVVDRRRSLGPFRAD